MYSRISSWLPGGATPALADHVNGHDEVARGGIKALEERVFNLEQAIQQIVDTNAATICPPGLFLDGDGACVDLQAQIDDLRGQIDALKPPALVFITSEIFVGDEVGIIDGVEMGALGGDAHCQRLANAAGHAGSFMAWLSDDVTSLDFRFDKDSGTYRLVDGTLIALSYDDLTDGSLANPIALDEFGGPLRSADVWTGTQPNGLASPPHCDNWTTRDSAASDAVVGDSVTSDFNWTSASTSSCGAQAALYCFEQE